MILLHYDCIYKKKLQFILSFINASKNIWMQVLRFGIAGLSTSIVTFFTYYSILFFNSRWYLMATIIAWIIATAYAFFINKRFVFKEKTQDKQKMLIQLLRNYIGYSGSLLLSVGLLFVEVELVGLSEWIAPLINIVITVPINFLINKFWTFHSD